MAATASDKKSSGVISARSNDNWMTPPGILGFSHLIVPDVFQGNDGKEVRNFKSAIHFNDPQQDALVARIQKHVIDVLWEKFLEEAEAASKRLGVPQGMPGKKVKGEITYSPWPKPSAQAWVDAHLEAIREGSSVGKYTQEPCVEFSNAADYRDKKTGELRMKTMRATDAAKNPVDIKKAMLGMGSSVQALLTGSIYYAPALATCSEGPAISVKLQGLVILKLVKWTGSGGMQGNPEVSDEDLALLGEDVTADDLSAYTREELEPGVAAGKAASPKGEEYSTELDDAEIPF